MLCSTPPLECDTAREQTLDAFHLLWCFCRQHLLSAPPVYLTGTTGLGFGHIYGFLSHASSPFTTSTARPAPAYEFQGRIQRLPSTYFPNVISSVFCI